MKKENETTREILNSDPLQLTQEKLQALPYYKRKPALKKYQLALRMVRTIEKLECASLKAKDYYYLHKKKIQRRMRLNKVWLSKTCPLCKAKMCKTSIVCKQCQAKLGKHLTKVELRKYVNKHTKNTASKR